MSDELSDGFGDEARRVRVRVEMVLEITEPDELIRAAWARIEGDTLMPAAERDQAAQAVSRDEAEAVAYLIDPVDLVGEVPGVVLAQASWSSERVDADEEDGWEDDDFDRAEGFGAADGDDDEDDDR
ncbi:hypothetical protein [Streptomyces marincola]|uniref:hypothetical protein n=1 Tax=Streptomyces marincola TaxID=2878388 RepID=UPI001CF19AF1|nr:hypothetical protein [Streptomyces marincola]UCM90031.1 hypothetical protein LC193_19935 [Streptomyces marincola]